jgi:3-dehydroquinate synthetase
VDDVRRVLARFGLPQEPFGGLPRALTPEPAGKLTAAEFLAATRSDKKARAGRVEYVLLEELGRVALDHTRGGAWSRPVDDEVIRQVLFP